MNAAIGKVRQVEGDLPGVPPPSPEWGVRPFANGCCAARLYREDAPDMFIRIHELRNPQRVEGMFCTREPHPIEEVHASHFADIDEAGERVGPVLFVTLWGGE